MDKRTLYGRFIDRQVGQYRETVFVCGIVEPCSAFNHPLQRCTDCQEKVLVSPSDLAQVEELLKDAKDYLLPCVACDPNHCLERKKCEGRDLYEKINAYLKDDKEADKDA